MSASIWRSSRKIGTSRSTRTSKKFLEDRRSAKPAEQNQQEIDDLYEEIRRSRRRSGIDEPYDVFLCLIEH